MLFRILGLILAIGTLVTTGSFSMWTNAYSHLTVSGLLIGVFLLSGNFKLHVVGFWGSLSETQALKAAVGFKMGRYYCIGAALIGSMIGWVIVLANLHDPPAIGPAMSIALLSSLYSFVYAFFLYLPAQANLERPFGFHDRSIVKYSLLCVVIALIHVLLTLLTLSLALNFNGASIETKQAVDIGPFTLLNPKSLLLIASGTCSIFLFSGQNIGHMFSALFLSNATAKNLLEAAAAWREPVLGAPPEVVRGMIENAMIINHNYDTGKPR